MVALAVKVTFVFEQTAVAEEDIVTAGVELGATVTKMELDVTVKGLAQFALESISTLIISLVTSVLLV